MSSTGKRSSRWRVVLVAVILFSSGLGVGILAAPPSSNGVWSGDWIREKYAYFSSGLQLPFTTAGRVLIAGAGGNVTTDSDLSFSGQMLTATDLKFTNDFYWGASNRTDVLAYPEQAASYVVWGDGATYYAKSGTTGVVTSNANAATLIQATINALPVAGGEIHFKAFTFTLLAPLTCSGKSIIFSGEGGERTRLDGSGLADYALQIVGPSTTVLASFITIKDLCIYGGVKVANASNIYFERDFFSFGIAGKWLVDIVAPVYDISFNYCELFGGTGAGGLLAEIPIGNIYDIAGLIIDGCVIGSVPNYLIKIENNAASAEHLRGCVITNSWVEPGVASPSFGIYLYNTYGVKISNNMIIGRSDNAHDLIHITGTGSVFSYFTDIHDNNIEAWGEELRYAIYSDYTRYTSIINNVIKGVTGDLFTTTDTTHILINDNTFVTAKVTINPNQYVTISTPDETQNGLVLYMPFEGVTALNRVIDCSTLSNEGTNNGATVVAGKRGNALSFDGTNDFVDVPDDNSLDMSRNFTVISYIKTTGNDENSGRVVAKRDASLGYEVYIYTASGQVDLFIGDASGTDDIISVKSVIDGVWHQIVCQRISNEIRIYIDGILDKNVVTTKTGDLSNAGNLFIGKYKGNSRWFDGTIDEVSVYNRALSADEIKQDWLSTTYNQNTINIVNTKLTSNSGTGVNIALHATHAHVTHGLSYTPTAADIGITWTTSLTNCTSWSVTGISGTEFVVTLYDANGAAKGPSGTVTFSWKSIKTP